MKHGTNSGPSAASAVQGASGPRSGARIALLGPQHQRPILRPVLEAIGAAGPIVLVSAGWEEREAETGDLEKHLGDRVTNLGLWPACEAAFEEDHALRALMFRRYDRMRDLARVYRVRLTAELSAMRTLMSELEHDGALGPNGPDESGARDRAEAEALVIPALQPAFDALRALDAHHASRVAALNDEVFAETERSDVVRRVHERVREELDGAGTLLVAGGHVGILYNRMRLFGVVEALPTGAAVVGWSAGAMVLTDRILLFHDSPPQGPGDAEIHGPGLGLAAAVVALPHADSRLELHDRMRTSLLARRLAPSQVVALDVGDWVEPDPGGGWRAGVDVTSPEAAPAAAGDDATGETPRASDRSTRRSIVGARELLTSGELRRTTTPAPEGVLQ